jgi:hypothetical protein
MKKVKYAFMSQKEFDALHPACRQGAIQKIEKRDGIFLGLFTESQIENGWVVHIVKAYVEDLRTKRIEKTIPENIEFID